jgi:hypothetical protein
VAVDPSDAALRAWAEADPHAAAMLIRDFAGPGFVSARLAAEVVSARPRRCSSPTAELRPDDRILVLGRNPAWLGQALAVTRGRAETTSAATVLIADRPPDALPPTIRRVILIGGWAMSAAPEITVSRPEDWTYPRESSAARESSAD